MCCSNLNLVLLEEKTVYNTDIDSARLYTQPEEVHYAYKELGQVENGMFTCAASFGNVHGVYAPGNVDLQPVILHNNLFLVCSPVLLLFFSFVLLSGFFVKAASCICEAWRRCYRHR